MMIDIENIKTKLIPELVEYLQKPPDGFSGHSDYKIKEVEKITGGAHTQIFGFDFCFNDSTDSKLPSEKNRIPLIIRIFPKRNSLEHVKKEYKLLQSLYRTGYSVPRPVFHKHSQQIGQSYLVMERIVGVTLTEIWEQSFEGKSINLFKQYIEKMFLLHTLDWQADLPELPAPDIEKDPYIIPRQTINRLFPLIKKYPDELSEVNLIVLWLTDHISEAACDELVFIHGDYHSSNLIVRPDNELVIIDWNDAELSDYRFDLAYSIVVTNSGSPIDLKAFFIQEYESLSSKKVINIEYFMVLSHLGNLTRIYSTITNHEITGESEYTRELYLKAYRPFTEYLVKMIENTTSISLSNLKHALSL